MNCDQCHGCAFKPGAAANQEPHNQLRGAFAALGGFPFICHEAMGWTPDRKGYPRDLKPELALLMTNTKALEALGVTPEMRERQIRNVRESVKVCGGWKAAIRRLKADGWFRNRTVTYIRRVVAMNAAAALHRLETKDLYDPDYTGTEPEDVRRAVEWFRNEAREAGIKIAWLFTPMKS